MGLGGLEVQQAGEVMEIQWAGGNNMGQGQKGMFGGLLKTGMGALGGLGMLSNRISLGKFLY